MNISKAKVFVPLKRHGKLLNITYRFYNSLKGKISKSVIKKPYQIVEVPVGLIKDQNWPFESEALRKLLVEDSKTVGIILDGDWDLNRRKFDDKQTSIAIRERFVEGKEWEETVYFTKFNREVEKRGAARGGCKTWDQFKKDHLDQWDNLYNDIKKQGYKNQKALNGRPENEIRVGVSRNGEFLFYDGRHRLAMVKALQVDKVPVIVRVWHKMFIDAFERDNKKNATPEKVIDYILKSSRK